MNSNTFESRKFSGRKLSVVIGLLLLAACIVAFVLSRPRSSELLRQAQIALERQDYQRTISTATEISRHDSLWPEAVLIAGEAARLDGRPSAAAEFYTSVPRDGSPQSVEAAVQLGEFAFSARRLSAAETEYRYVLKHDPQHLHAHERMGFLLGVTGRRWESHEHFQFLLKHDRCNLEQLVFWIDLDRPVDQERMLRDFAEAAPDDIAVKLGLAAHYVQKQHTDEARTTLNSIIAKRPDLLAAHALSGELLNSSDSESYQSWRSKLPPTADRHPGIWFVRGVQAKLRDEQKVAARCFQETLRRAAGHRRAVYQLGQVLVDLDLTAGEEFAKRSRQLYELTRSMDDVLQTSGRDATVIHHVVDLLREMGRFPEAQAWALHASRTIGGDEWPGLIAQISAQIDSTNPSALAAKDFALRFDLSAFPVDSTETGVVEGSRSASGGGGIHFVEEADCGIDFEYTNGPDPSTKGVRMFEQNGGGVAVLDFDGDQCPDLFFTQGAEWKTGATVCSPSADTVDRLYRNVQGQTFRDVTAECGIDEREFSQGCAVGDFDNDGFPDVYVANIGRNRLFHNNGDGTFTDLTGVLELQEWTSSCVIVDLNADGDPDLFDVNFVDGPDVFTRICDGHGCNPRQFAGIPDRLLISRGDGTFENVSEATPNRQPKGLGVLAADLETRGRPDLLIANDAVPNFLLRNSAAPDTAANVQLTEVGFATGLAFSRDGLAQACMGIAADDVDGDGRMDFFLTNFRHEPNVLYLQTSRGHFVDATHAAQLHAPAMPYVSWGTQFLDPDLNGELDIVVVNGHIDDYRDEGGEYHQRPQFFENTGDACFRELTGEEVGDYFDRKSLGRGLARIDWNLDGRTDFAVSNMLSRASLVTNTTERTGHFLNLQLRAVSSARDAIGTVVELKTTERTWTKQLVAGDGFMASNQRMLQFGLGASGKITSIRVTWPSGAVQLFASPPVDSTLMLIEGHHILSVSK